MKTNEILLQYNVLNYIKKERMQEKKHLTQFLKLVEPRVGFNSTPTKKNLTKAKYKVRLDLKSYIE